MLTKRKETMVLTPKEKMAYAAGMAEAAEIIEGWFASADSLQKQGVIDLLPKTWAKIQEMKIYKPEPGWEEYQNPGERSYTLEELRREWSSMGQNGKSDHRFNVYDFLDYLEKRGTV